MVFFVLPGFKMTSEACCNVRLEQGRAVCVPGLPACTRPCSYSFLLVQAAESVTIALGYHPISSPLNLSVVFQVLQTFFEVKTLASSN